MVGRYVIVAEMGKLYHPARQELHLSTSGAEVKLTLAPAHGSLIVAVSPPDAEIWLDGEKVGTGRYENAQKPSGTYDLRVSKAKHVSHQEEVTVRDGTTTERKIALQSSVGTLAVTSEPPGAQIWLDGKNTGSKTPHEFTDLESGLYRVALTLDGYGEVSQQAQVERGGRKTIEAALPAKLGLLSIMSSYSDGTPCRGKVYVDGEEKGTTPAKFQLTARSHEVRVACDKGEHRESVIVPHNEKVSLEWVVESSQDAEPDDFVSRFRIEKPEWVDGGTKVGPGVWWCKDESLEKCARISYCMGAVAWAGLLSGDLRVEHNTNETGVTSSLENSRDSAVRMSGVEWWLDQEHESVMALLRVPRGWLAAALDGACSVSVDSASTLAWSVAGSSGDNDGRWLALARALAYAVVQLGDSLDSVECSGLSKEHASWTPGSGTEETLLQYVAKCSHSLQLAPGLQMSGSTRFLESSLWRAGATKSEEEQVSSDFVTVKYCPLGGDCCEVSVSDGRLMGGAAKDPDVAVACLARGLKEAGIRWNHRYIKIQGFDDELCIVEMQK